MCDRFVGRVGTLRSRASVSFSRDNRLIFVRFVRSLSFGRVKTQDENVWYSGCVRRNEFSAAKQSRSDSGFSLFGFRDCFVRYFNLRFLNTRRRERIFCFGRSCIYFLFIWGRFLVVSGRLMAKGGGFLAKDRPIDRFVGLEVLPTGLSEASSNGFAAFVRGVCPSSSNGLGGASPEGRGDFSEVPRLGVSVVDLSHPGIFKAPYHRARVYAGLPIFRFEVRFNCFRLVVFSVANGIDKGLLSSALRVVLIGWYLCLRVDDGGLASVFPNEGKLPSLYFGVARLPICEDFRFRIFGAFSCRYRASFRVRCVLIRATCLDRAGRAVLASPLVRCQRLFFCHFVFLHDLRVILPHCRLPLRRPLMLSMAAFLCGRFFLGASAVLLRARPFLLRACADVARLVFLVNRVYFALRSASVRREVARTRGRVPFLCRHSFFVGTFLRSSTFCDVRMGRTTKGCLSGRASVVVGLVFYGYDSDSATLIGNRKEANVAGGGVGGRCRCRWCSHASVGPPKDRALFAFG